LLRNTQSYWTYLQNTIGDVENIASHVADWEAKLKARV
jgi:hypothetical protein